MKCGKFVVTQIIWLALLILSKKETLNGFVTLVILVHSCNHPMHFRFLLWKMCLSSAKRMIWGNLNFLWTWMNNWLISFTKSSGPTSKPFHLRKKWKEKKLFQLKLYKASFYRVFLTSKISRRDLLTRKMYALKQNIKLCCPIS